MNRTLDTDGDGLTDFQESKIGTRADLQIPMATESTTRKTAGPLDARLAPPCLPEPNYVVIDIGMTGYAIEGMNSNGDLLLSGNSSIGLWSMGEFTLLPKFLAEPGEPSYVGEFSWNAINDSGTAVGVLSEFNGNYYYSY